MVKSIPATVTAYSPKFSRSWQDKQAHHYKKSTITSALTTLILGFLATLSGVLGFPPQATSLGTCTVMGGIATAVALRSLRKHKQILKKQKAIQQHLRDIKKELIEEELISTVKKIEKAVSVYPLSFAHMRDYHKLNNSLLKATLAFSQNPLLAKDWGKGIGLLHKLPFHLANGRTVVLDLKHAKAILKGQSPFSEELKDEPLDKNPSTRDLKAIESLFRQSAIEPSFSKTRKALKEQLQKNDFSVIVMREKQNIIGMVWLKEKAEGWAIRHCVRAADQPSSREIEEKLIKVVVEKYSQKKLKVCALKSDRTSQKTFEKLGFVYSGVRAGLYGFLEDGMVRMTRPVPLENS